MISKKISLHIVFGLAIIVLLSTAGISQSLEQMLCQRWRWVKFTSESGLPSNAVNNIINTPDGTVWVACDNGFAWFDGYIWNRTGGNKLTLNYTDCLDIAPDNTSGLILCHYGKLNLIKKSGISEISLNYEKLPLEIQQAFALNNTDYILKAKPADSKYPSLFFYQNKRLEKLNYPFENPEYAISARLIATKSGRIWLNSSDGLYVLNGSKWRKLIENEKDELIDMSPPLEDDNGTGFFTVGFPASKRGIWQYSNTSYPRFYHPRQILYQTGGIFPDGKALFSYTGGYFEIHDLTKDDFANELIPNIQFENIPTELENASKILISSKGNLWTITPEGLFFCRLSSNRWSYWKYPKYDPRNFVNEIIKTADNSYLIATDGGLLIKYANGSEKLIDKIENTTLRGLTGLACDDSGRIWISSGGVFGGAFCLENGKWRRYGSKEGLTDAPIHKIRIDSQHNLWFLTLSLETLSMGNGAFELKNGKFYRYDKSTGIISDRVYDFTEGAEGDLWFATNEGLSRFKNNQWKHWTINNGLRTSRVYTIVQDKQNRLWFSDGYSGVCYVDNDEIKFDSTLDSANVMQVTNLKFDDSGRLWIASKSGLFCYNKGVLSKFDKNRGLSAKYVWPIFFDKNRILAGTNGGGINVLYFDELDEPLPNVFFNQVLNKSGAHIISWKAFSFWGQIPPEDIEVRYRLDGGKWSSWSINRSITYYDLDPGNHIFEIEAKGLFGNINKIPIQLKFEVEEPIYLKPVFLIPIISLLALFIIFGLNYFEKKRKFVKELKKSQSNLSALIENTSDQIILLDSDFKIAHANSRFFAEYEKYHSYKPEIGDRLSEINDNREADFWSIIQTDAFNGKNFHSEHILNYQDKPYYYEVMAYPISVGDEFAGITIYMKNITYYKETEEKIKNSLVEKELLIKEINSRVKNNMQYILFLIDLQISGIKDDDIRRHLRKTQARILALSLIFDKLYQNENLTKIDMNEYCQRITQAQLEKFIMHGSSIDFNLIANKILLPIETAISCGLIINELFTNSLQYAFPPGFDAKVDLEIKAADNSKYQIFYKDNGVGLPKDINPYTSRSIGLFLINDISKHRLNGSIEISCERGTSFLITFNELGNRNN